MPWGYALDAVGATTGFGGTLGAAALTGGTLAAGGGIASSIIGSNAASDAANAQIAAGQQALGTVQATEAPFVAGGTNALAQLQKALGIGPGGTGAIDPTGFQGSPGFGFAKQQGIEAITNSAAARGGVQGGNTLKALDTFGTGLANQDFNSYLAQLMGLTGTGANAAAGVASAGSGIIQGQGNAQAAGIVGGANAINAGIGGVTGATNNLVQLQFLQSLLNRGGGGAPVNNPFATPLSGPFGGNSTVADANAGFFG